MPSTPRSFHPGAVLALVSGAQFMVILDLAIVNVALPSIQGDLAIDPSDLQWVAITYGLALGGFLLLGGRAADLFGRRRVLVAGLALFAVASLAAGLANSLAQLVVSRGVQGVGAAMAAPAALSIVTSTFPEGAARNKALGIFGAVGGMAASIGVIAGGLLTDGPGWEWVFLINVPIGAALVTMILAFVPATRPASRTSADVAGAVSVTAGLLAIVYAINRSVDYGWTSSRTVGLLVGGVAMLGVFVAVESRAASPLVPLAVFRRRIFTAANVVSALLWGAFFAMIFQGTLFMQQALGYSAVNTGAAWLASTLSSLVIAAAIAPAFVGRFGSSTSLVVGQTILGVGLLYLTRAPGDAAYWTDLFPGFLAFGVGIGFSMMAVQAAAFTGVDHTVAGVAGGMIETSREVGGALGVAVVATLAIARTDTVLAGGSSPAAALTAGFQRGSLVAALIAFGAAVAAGVLLRRAERFAVRLPDSRAAATQRVLAGGEPGLGDVRNVPSVAAVGDHDG
ncbi:MAG: MFS transporter [Acidimicrobiales bacterium]